MDPAIQCRTCIYMHQQSGWCEALEVYLSFQDQEKETGTCSSFVYDEGYCVIVEKGNQ